MPDDYDNPWKEALDSYLPHFMGFFFPELAAAIDWDQGYTALDHELVKIAPNADLGNRLADKLFKVFGREGQEVWILIHIEVQSQIDKDFPRRMYVYHYRIYDNYGRPAVSLAILGDAHLDWRPNHFAYSQWGCSLRLDFPTVKLMEYADRVEELERSANAFAAVVLAHVKTVETNQDPGQRQLWKFRVVKGLFERGLSASDVRQFFRIIDWLMALPQEFELQFQNELYEFEGEKKMPYVTSIERMGIEKGIEKGLAKGRLEGIEGMLEIKYAADGLSLMPRIRLIEDVAKLEAVQRAIKTSVSLDEVRRLLP